jgi:hypothetical protein
MPRYHRRAPPAAALPAGRPEPPVITSPYEYTDPFWAAAQQLRVPSPPPTPPPPPPFGYQPVATLGPLPPYLGPVAYPSQPYSYPYHSGTGASWQRFGRRRYWGPADQATQAHVAPPSYTGPGQYVQAVPITIPPCTVRSSAPSSPADASPDYSRVYYRHEPHAWHVTPYAPELQYHHPPWTPADYAHYHVLLREYAAWYAACAADQYCGVYCSGGPLVGGVGSEERGDDNDPKQDTQVAVPSTVTATASDPRGHSHVSSAQPTPAVSASHTDNDHDRREDDDESGGEHTSSSEPAGEGRRQPPKADSPPRAEPSPSLRRQPPPSERVIPLPRSALRGDAGAVPPPQQPPRTPETREVEPSLRPTPLSAADRLRLSLLNPPPVPQQKPNNERAVSPPRTTNHAADALRLQRLVKPASELAAMEPAPFRRQRQHRVPAGMYEAPKEFYERRVPHNCTPRDDVRLTLRNNEIPHLRIGGVACEVPASALANAILKICDVRVRALVNFRAFHGLAVVVLDDPARDAPKITAAFHQTAWMSLTSICFVPRPPPSTAADPYTAMRAKLEGFAASIPSGVHLPRRLMTCERWEPFRNKAPVQRDDFHRIHRRAQRTPIVKAISSSSSSGDEVCIW